MNRVAESIRPCPPGCWTQQVVHHAFLQPEAVVHAHRQTLLYALKNLGLLALAIPNHVYICQVGSCPAPSQTTSPCCPSMELPLCRTLLKHCLDSQELQCRLALWSQVYYCYGLEQLAGAEHNVHCAEYQVSCFMRCGCVQYLWSRARVSTTTLLMLTPLSVLPLLLADSTATQMLAGIGVTVALMQYFLMRHVRQQGNKFI